MKHVLVLLSLLAVPAATAAAEPPGGGALAKYVAKPDDSFAWSVRRTGTLGATEYAELRLTSQTWKDILWRHQLFVINPSTTPADCSHGLLFITGGRWRDSLLQEGGDSSLPREAGLFASVAEELKTPVAVLLQVPFQPMFDGRYEDQIIALTFEKFLDTGQEEWPLLLPMVKSAVRAMDATSEHCKKAWSLDVKTYTVAGASKRGWTTWLTGAVDRRATALAPMVIDTLNMQVQMKHQLKAWGAYSYQIKDYTERGLQQRLETEEGQRLRDIVDPYSYRHALRQQKLIIIGTNDHYWPLDALNLYWEDLPGAKHILYVPNNRHGLNDYQRLLGSLGGLHQAAAAGKSLPDLKWKFTQENGRLALRVESDPPPISVKAWTAVAPTRDFRDAKWTSASAGKVDDDHLCAMPLPERGFAAMFGEAAYQGGSLPIYLSTNVKIVEASSP